MKQFITLAITLCSLAVQAQQGFFQTIEANGKDAIYEGFTGLSPQGDGTYEFLRGQPAIKISILRIESRIPVGFSGTPIKEDWGSIGETELSDYGRMDSYPHTMNMKHTYTNDGYIIIDDMLFVVNDIPDKSLPTIEDVTTVYVVVKDRLDAKNTEKKGKKKKGGFMSRIKKKIEGAGASPTYKYLKSVNLEKKFKDYVTAMKAKQATPPSAKDKSDMAKIKKTREMGDQEIKRYNDSIKATPKYKKLKEHQARMKKMESNTIVTLRNNTGHTIYVGTSGSRNRGTKINRGDTARWNCDTDAYLQTETVSGGSHAYSSSNSSVYSSNSGCGNTVNIN